jgi:hypothetical protein
MARRPSTTQILARQARLARYQRETGKTDRALAKEFNVSLEQLRNFQRRPAEQKAGWSHNKASQALYSAMGSPSGAGSTKVRGVRVSATKADRKILSEIPSDVPRIERLYQRNQTIRFRSQAQIWRDYADSQGLPHSFNSIKDMYDSDEISSRTYYAAVRKLHEAYGKKGKR